VAEGRLEEARPHLEHALEIFPGDGDPAGPASLLAGVLRTQGKLDDSAGVLEGLVAVNESHVDGNIALGEIRAELGDTASAVEAFERAAWIFPYDMDLQVRLAETAEAAGNWPVAVDARVAVVALRPVDRAEALYRLANAHFRAGDSALARRRVLESLEIAPSFQEALNLLLEIRRGVPS
jgi:tetratricopeptide (TPR) repeat protein